MTFSVLKSHADQIQDFERQVGEFHSTLMAWRLLEGVPAPATHPLVEACIKRDPVDGTFSIDYQIVDDTPPPPPLVERKMVLINASRQREAAEIASVLPPGKVRLWQMKFQAANLKQDKSADDLAVIAEFTAMQQAVDVICLAGAEREAAIEDLTEETIGGWAG